MLKRIRCGRGLGDSVYLQSIVRHKLAQDGRLQVHSDFPDVFSQLGKQVRVVPFSRNVDIVAHYATRKGVVGTTQFQDCCIRAGITEPVDLRLDWTATDLPLVDALMAFTLPVVVVQMPRSPMGRVDGFGAELLPDCRAIQRAIDRLKGSALIVQVGSGEPLFRFEGIDVDLANKTTVRQLLDVASVASAFLGYVSFIVPLAESLGKPALLVWARAGLKAAPLYVRQITPEKVLHKKTSRFVMDDASPQKIEEAADALLR